MIVFDSKTGKFRDADTGRLRSDISGLLSSNARRQYKEFAGNVDVKEYRRKLGQKYHKPSEYVERKKKVVHIKGKLAESKRKRKVFEETEIMDYSDYMEEWLDDFDFVLEEEDTDLETP
jgi:hypothetical protein